MTIDNEAASQRLARALLSDVVSYNRSKLAGGGDARSVLATELDEARALFRARVASELHSVFERELAGLDLSAAKPRALSPPVVGLVIVLALSIVGYLVLAR